MSPSSHVPGIPSVSYSGRRAAPILRALYGAWARLLSALKREDLPSWTSLNAHLLTDIGESTASAEREVLHDPLNAHFGSNGGRVGAGLLPLLAQRASPLG